MSGGVNIATYNNLNLEEGEEFNSHSMWEDYYRGAGLSVGYLSPVGPVEFSVSHNDDFDDILYQFSIGYTLD